MDYRVFDICRRPGPVPGFYVYIPLYAFKFCTKSVEILLKQEAWIEIQAVAKIQYPIKSQFLELQTLSHYFIRQYRLRI